MHGRGLPTQLQSGPVVAEQANARLGIVSPPMNRAIPMTPSLPTTAISADAPSAMTYSSDTIEVMGKYMYLSVSPAS